MILSNDGLVAFHYRSYGTFFLHKNKLHKIRRGFTHYKYYRANKPILCGSCKKTLTYEEYREKGSCPYCAALFNPACQSHHSYYFK